MRMDALIELATEAGPVVVRAVGAVVTAVAGTVVELNGIRTLGTGGGITGLWMAFVGCLLLVVCYVLASETIAHVRGSFS